MNARAPVFVLAAAIPGAQPQQHVVVGAADAARQLDKYEEDWVVHAAGLRVLSVQPWPGITRMAMRPFHSADGSTSASTNQTVRATSDGKVGDVTNTHDVHKLPAGTSKRRVDAREHLSPCMRGALSPRQRPIGRCVGARFRRQLENQVA